MFILVALSKSIIKLLMITSRNRPAQLSSLIANKQFTTQSHLQLEQYKKNMQVFMNEVQHEFSRKVDMYQKKINELQSENNSLKQRLSKYQSGTSSLTGYINNMKKSTDFKPSQNRKNGFENLSQILTPVKVSSNKNRKSSDFQFIPFSNVFASELPIKSTIDTHANFLSSNYPEDISKNYSKTERGNLSKSKFQRQNTKKKQNQQSLIHFLQMGKSNLDMNTTRIFQLLGIQQKKVNPQAQENSEQKKTEGKGALKKKVSISDNLNSSLSSICDSLNNSFHAKKSQEKKRKMKDKEKKQEEQKKRKQKQQQEILKEQSIKNLLKTMRNNIDHSPQRPPQVIRSSKLMMTGPRKKSKTQSKSKVMINPVPIDLQKKTDSQPTSKILTSSPAKQPQSILKNSQSKILGHSLANISAISFYQSGEQ